MLLISPVWFERVSISLLQKYVHFFFGGGLKHLEGGWTLCNNRGSEQMVPQKKSCRPLLSACMIVGGRAAEARICQPIIGGLDSVWMSGFGIFDHWFCGGQMGNHNQSSKPPIHTTKKREAERICYRERERPAVM